jgi:hypothetical protein
LVERNQPLILIFGRPTLFRLSKRLDAEMLPPVTTILGIEEPPHVADTGDDNRLETPMDELWGIKHRIDLVGQG